MKVHSSVRAPRNRFDCCQAGDGWAVVIDSDGTPVSDLLSWSDADSLRVRLNMADFVGREFLHDELSTYERHFHG